MAHKWVHSSAYSSIPEHAVVGGNDADGAMMYVGRSFHNGDMLVAKIIPSKHIAFVSSRGQEIAKTHFEVLCGESLTWQHCYDHVMPPNAITCGNTALGQPVYVGRGYFEGSLTVGKVSSVHRALFIPFAGMERRLESYEILVESEQASIGWKHAEVCKAPLSPTLPPPPPPFEEELCVMKREPASLLACEPPKYFDSPPPYTAAAGMPATNYAPAAPPAPYMPAQSYTPAATPTFKPAQPYEPPSTQSYAPPIFKPAHGYEGSMHGVPAQTYAPPAHSVPAQTYVPPAHSVPAQTYVPPAHSYPAQTYVPPSYPHVPPAHGHDTWINASPSYTPPNAVHAGHDTDMSTIYVIRAYHGGELIPGKGVPSRGCAYISHAGQEIQKYSYEVLVGERYHWVPSYEGNVVPGAVEAGRTSSGEPLYVGRAHYSGSLTPGKVQPSHRCLYIAYGGGERRISNYEVLVRSDDYYRMNF